VAPLESDVDPFPFDDDAPEEEYDLEGSLSTLSRGTVLAVLGVGICLQLGLFFGSVGIMLIGFRGQWSVGGPLAAGGALALVLAVVIYRRYRTRQP